MNGDGESEVGCDGRCWSYRKFLEIEGKFCSVSVSQHAKGTGGYMVEEWMRQIDFFYDIFLSNANADSIETHL